MELPHDIHRAGRKRLRQLLPWARGEARKTYEGVEAETQIGGAMMQYISEENMEALVVYPTELGGWHADLRLKSVPPGISNAIGSPVQSPYRTKQQAEAGARRLLCMCMLTAQENAQKAQHVLTELPPAFLLMGATMPLFPEMFGAIAERHPGLMSGWEAPEESVQRIRATLERCPGPFSPQAFVQWDEATQALVLGAIHMAALNGVFRYPPIAHRSPSGHTAETSTTRH